ncbi:hypothetical protein JOB18_038283 [Solea senegalensis]|uniref:Uncharacterized protein n=1 Tax=Solea senegalensis TaxID=28829 RepID=A0AAV6QMZ3_SOLSE|nr:hypothetical protein JOB18_038283 [Solea senegalensis]
MQSSRGTSQLRPSLTSLNPLQATQDQVTADTDMALYADLALQDSVKEQLFRCKLHMLERKCCTGVEKLKALLGEHLQSGIPLSELLEKTKSFLTLKKALLSHSGYSKYSRDILRLFPDMEEDLAPLCF